MKTERIFYMILGTLLLASFILADVNTNSDYNFRGIYRIYNVSNLTVVNNVTADSFLGNVDCSQLTGALSNVCTLYNFNDVSLNATQSQDNSSLWVGLGVLDEAHNATQSQDNSSLWVGLGVLDEAHNATQSQDNTSIWNNLTDVATQLNLKALNISLDQYLALNSYLEDNDTVARNYTFGQYLPLNIYNEDNATGRGEFMSYANIAMQNATNYFQGLDTWAQEITLLDHAYLDNASYMYFGTSNTSYIYFNGSNLIIHG